MKERENSKFLVERIRCCAKKCSIDKNWISTIFQTITEAKIGLLAKETESIWGRREEVSNKYKTTFKISL